MEKKHEHQSVSTNGSLTTVIESNQPHHLGHLRHMKILGKFDFWAEAGIPLHQARDFSLYDGAPYACACGSTHSFQQFANHQLYGSNGATAKFVVQCPNNDSVVTLIRTKNKFVILFDRFESLAGCVDA